jgi:hypothetical protein
MVAPRFNFFITQDDGKILGSAVNPENNEPVAYLIAPNGGVSARLDGSWYDLPGNEAAFVRVCAGRAYHHSTNYLTHAHAF